MKGREAMHAGGHEKATEGRAGCRLFDAQLAAYLEGEARPEVIAHAQGCPFCRVVLGDLEQIISQSRLIGLEEPPARLWANIRVTLAEEGIFRPTLSGWGRWSPRFFILRNPAAVAALACLVVLGAILLVPPRAGEQNGTSNWFSRRAEVTVATAVHPGEENNLARTVEEMETTYQRREISFEPTLKASYQKSLASLDTSIRECLDSLRQEPSNTLAREYLLTAYARKAEVLTSALQFDGH